MTKHGTASQVTGSYVEFQAAVLRALPRDINPDVALGWTQNCESLARILREALTPDRNKKSSNTFPVTVNYNLLVEDAVRLGRYDSVNSDITSYNFKTEQTGVAEVVVELICFRRVISVKDVLSEFDQQGYRPAELHELLAFGKKYPDVQREFPVVALGSVRQDRFRSRLVPYLSGSGSERRLNLFWFEHGSDEVCRFAAVRK